MTRKVLITLWRDTIAARFDLASEVLIATRGDTGIIDDRKTLVLPSVSPEDLCRLILAEGIDVVICNGIEKEYYEYLTWKKVEIIDSVMGPYESALDLFAAEKLRPGTVLFKRSAQRMHHKKS